MRRGYTVVELTLVLAIIGLVLGIALPRLAPLRDSWTAEQAAQALVLAHSRARVAAILMSRPLVLTVAAESLRITTQTDSVVWRAAGPAAAGATLIGPIRKLTFSPVGLTTGLSNATFQIRRGAALRSVVVSRLGRVRILHGS
jgi:prepilin-type N-terminal cleavage/methylation domain-containing protein